MQEEEAEEEVAIAVAVLGAMVGWRWPAADVS